MVFYCNPEYALKRTIELNKEKTTQKMLRISIKNPHITGKELADFIGLTDDGIKYHLTNMQKKGILRRIGQRHGR